MKIKLYVSFCAAVLTLSSMSAFGLPWTSFFGSHYSDASWGHIVRTHIYGIDYGTSGAVLPSESKLSNLEADLQANDMVLLVGGLGSARDIDRTASYMDAISADGGESWRNAVHDWYSSVVPLQTENKIFVQIGNEITSEIYSETLHSWANDGIAPSAYDFTTIPYYVEYYLAPTVSALRSAANDSNTSVQILLGSITNFATEQAEDWLDELLEYEVVGTFASDLAGKQVYELIDILAIHYLLQTDKWLTKLESVRKNWSGVGRVRGLWSTEEIGVSAAENGRAARLAIRHFGRYLTWRNHRAFQGRAIIWGQNTGAEGFRASDAFQTIFDFVGDAELQTSRKIFAGQRDVEQYGFSDATSGKKLAVLTHTGDSNATSLDELVAHVNSFDGTPSAVTAHLFSEVDGYSAIELTVKKEENGPFYIITFPSAIELNSGNALLITVTS